MGFLKIIKGIEDSGRAIAQSIIGEIIHGLYNELGEEKPYYIIKKENNIKRKILVIQNLELIKH